MREVTVRLKFTQPCLGKVKVMRDVSQGGVRKKRPFFMFHRDVEGRVTFMQQWWQSILRKSADVLCRHQQVVKQLRFSLQVDGTPRAFKRYYAEDRYSPHEAFLAGDVIGASCLVPDAINDDDLWRLLSTAGEYYGISPFRYGEFGFFSVVSIQRRSHINQEQPLAEPAMDVERAAKV